MIYFYCIISILYAVFYYWNVILVSFWLQQTKKSFKLNVSTKSLGLLLWNGTQFERIIKEKMRTLREIIRLEMFVMKCTFALIVSVGWWLVTYSQSQFERLRLSWCCRLTFVDWTMKLRYLSRHMFWLLFKFNSICWFKNSRHLLWRNTIKVEFMLSHDRNKIIPQPAPL